MAPLISDHLFHLDMSRFTNQPPKYKWEKANDASKIRIQRSQQEARIVARMEHICQQPCYNKQGVYDLNKDLIEVMHEAANNALTLKKPPKKYVGSKNKSVWFDTECRKTKRQTNKLAKNSTKFLPMKTKPIILTKERFIAL